MEPDEYCREIEAYLCRKNDGHLIRIVGPSFERVCGWAGRGIPFKIACHGIDRYCGRYYAKGPRRRPVQIDFCEADVLDAFDAWRRAVGVRATSSATEDAGPSRTGLSTHLARVILRLAARRAEASVTDGLGQILELAANEAVEFTRLGSPVRGEARARVLARLGELDREMIDASRRECPPETLKLLRQEAVEQLAPFRERMPAEAYERSLEAAVDRLIRERERLPTLTMA
jgi:hypothetical protein